MTELLGAWQPVYDEIIYQYYDSIGNYHWFGKYSGEHFVPRTYSSTNTNTKDIYLMTELPIYETNGISVCTIRKII